MTRIIQTLALITTLALFGAAFVGLAENQTQTQAQKQTQAAKQQQQHTIHDQNGDGICDVCGQPVGSGQQNAQGQKAKKGKHWGPGDGSGNQGVGPQDGTGYGARSGKRTSPQGRGRTGRRS